MTGTNRFISQHCTVAIRNERRCGWTVAVDAFQVPVGFAAGTFAEVNFAQVTVGVAARNHSAVAVGQVSSEGLWNDRIVCWTVATSFVKVPLVDHVT